MVWRGDGTAKLAPCLVKLIDEIDARAPGRDRRSDGSIGDRAHAARTSDHNPNAQGIVTALDITDDPGNLAADLVYDRDDFDPDVLFEHLRRRRDPRVKYLISDDRVCSSYGSQAWQWRTYTGPNPHDRHAHISVLADKVNDISTWFPEDQEDDMTPEQAQQLADIAERVRRIEHETRTREERTIELVQELPAKVRTSVYTARDGLAKLIRSIHGDG